MSVAQPQFEDLCEIVQVLGPEEALGNMKVTELRDCCRRFGLKLAGGKLDLIGRLGAHLVKPTEEAAAPRAWRGRPRGGGGKAETPATSVGAAAPSEAAAAAAAAPFSAPAATAAEVAPLPTPARNCPHQLVEPPPQVERPQTALSVIFTAATVAPAPSVQELPAVTRTQGPERTAQMLLGLKACELRHYCLGLGLQANGSKLELIDLLLARLHVLWGKATVAEATEESTADASACCTMPPAVAEDAPLEAAAAEDASDSQPPLKALVHTARWKRSAPGANTAVAWPGGGAAEGTEACGEVPTLHEEVASDAGVASAADVAISHAELGKQLVVPQHSGGRDEEAPQGGSAEGDTDMVLPDAMVVGAATQDAAEPNAALHANMVVADERGAEDMVVPEAMVVDAAPHDAAEADAALDANMVVADERGAEEVTGGAASPEAPSPAPRDSCGLEDVAHAAEQREEDASTTSPPSEAGGASNIDTGNEEAAGVENDAEVEEVEQVQEPQGAKAVEEAEVAEDMREAEEVEVVEEAEVAEGAVEAPTSDAEAEPRHSEGEGRTGKLGLKRLCPAGGSDTEGSEEACPEAKRLRVSNGREEGSEDVEGSTEEFDDGPVG